MEITLHVHTLANVVREGLRQMTEGTGDPELNSVLFATWDTLTCGDPHGVSPQQSAKIVARIWDETDAVLDGTATFTIKGA